MIWCANCQVEDTDGLLMQFFTVSVNVGCTCIQNYKISGSVRLKLHWMF